MNCRPNGFLSQSAKYLIPAITLFISGCGLIDSPRIKHLELSPDGAYLAASYRCGSEPMRIGIIDIETKTIKSQITGERGKYADSPAFSNDGNMIAFTSGVPREFPNGIYIYDLQEGSTREFLTSELPNGFPAFSPDDSRIAFLRAGRVRPKSAALAIGDIKVFEINLESNEVSQLTKIGQYAITGLTYVTANNLLVSGPGVGLKGEDAAIISSPEYNFEPIELGKGVSSVNVAISDGSIYFVAHANYNIPGTYNYEVFSLREGVKQQITSREAYLSSLSVSLTGRYITYLSDKDRDNQVEIIFEDLDNQKAEQIDKSILADCFK